MTFYSGKEVTRGWQATLERYRKKYKTEGSTMGKLAFRDLDIQVLGGEAAVVRGRFVLCRGAETATGLFTLLLKALAGGLADRPRSHFRVISDFRFQILDCRINPPSICNLKSQI